MSVRVNNQELLNNLREKHGSEFVSMSDLQHPTSEFMMRYFATVIAQLGIDIKGMSHHELIDSDYKDISAYIQVYKAVKKVCPVPKYFANFTVESLMEPKPEDIVYVAAMDNFYDFYFQHVTDHLYPREQEVESLQEMLQEQINQRSELQHQLNDRAAARSKRDMELVQAEREIEELNAELKDLQLQEQQWKEATAEQQKALIELRLEVGNNLKQQEQLEELKETQVELKALREETEQLRHKQAVQDEKLAEKHSALQEKASRERFLEECIMLETQATESAAELIELAVQVEKQHSRLLESNTQTEPVLRKFEAVMKKESQLESRKAALEEDIVVQQKILADSVKERKEFERNIQDIQGEEFEHLQNILSLEKKFEEVTGKIQETKEEISLMSEDFEQERNKLYKKAAGVKAELKAAMYCDQDQI
ncbi:hypothetical protein R5R35_005497 [Gryllus longicercus]|uniref:Uncharacterized protein n=1 Tax=Gryllus longicercus TaxID=2509291 RepID=A0AAN9WB60_9ORTH